MNKEIKLTNKQFAQELVAHLNEDKANAKLEEKDGKFIVSYEIAAADPSADQKMGNMVDMLCSRMDRMFSYVNNNLDNIYSNLQKHNTGHMPPLTPTALGKLLKNCGMEGDYQVQPKVIYASNGAV